MSKQLDLFGNIIALKNKKRKEPIRIKEQYKAYIALWSGGKDSTVMIDKMLRASERLDYIIFTDTKIEFEEMYEYIEKVSNYWKDRYNANIVFPTTDKNFEDMIFNIRGENGRAVRNPNNQGKISGLLNATAGFCEWRRISKIRPYEKFLKENKLSDDEVLCYVGFTIDESNRTKRHKHEAYPLIDLYRMREADCNQYLIDMETKFKKWQNLGFEPSTEPLKDCFCKI